MFNDLIGIKNPKISVISPSLNNAKFLRETIESVLRQSYRDFEHIIVDGGSTDSTISILKEYPHIKWISEKDSGVLEAYTKGFRLAKGQYIIQCCISDGFINENWFKRCAGILDSENEISLVWGLPQYMTEKGDLGEVSYNDFFDNPPPQKMHFLSFWLATGFWFPEGNYCIRRDVFEKCIPECTPKDPFYDNFALGLIFNFNVFGYLPYFIPVVANYGRIHKGSRGQGRYDIEHKVQSRYFDFIDNYRKQLFRGKFRHAFKDGSCRILKEIVASGINEYKKEFLKQRFFNSRFMRLVFLRFLRN